MILDRCRQSRPHPIEEFGELGNRLARVAWRLVATVADSDSEASAATAVAATARSVGAATVGASNKTLLPKGADALLAWKDNTMLGTLPWTVSALGRSLRLQNDLDLRRRIFCEIGAGDPTEMPSHPTGERGSGRS